MTGLAASGCASGEVVDRLYDGHVVEGRFIEPEAYAAFLSGVISEAGGDLRSALASYARAERLDPESPEIWTRIAAVRCAASPRDPRADEALAKALAADAGYAGAWRVEAKCALSRGEHDAADAAANRAAELEAPPAMAGMLSHAGGRSIDDASRRRIVELTETASNPAAAFHALATWAEAHDDFSLWSRALVALAKIAPLDRAQIAGAAEALAGWGAVGQAQAVAAAMVDASEEPSPNGPRGLAGRLALDEAIGRRSVDALRRRAVRTRLGLDEAAARAWLSNDDATARDLASEVARADPQDLASRLVLASGEPQAAVPIAMAVRPDAPPVGATVWVAFGASLARALPVDLARSAMARIAHDPLTPGDEPVVRAAAALASRGVVDVAALPPDGVVELHVLRGRSASAEGWSAPQPGSLDPIHFYLALALAEPNRPRTRELGSRFARVQPEDRLVAAAQALVLLGSGDPIAPASAQALLARDPADPLVAAVALRLAEKAGDADVVRRARDAVRAIAGVRAGSVTE